MCLFAYCMSSFKMHVLKKLVSKLPLNTMPYLGMGPPLLLRTSAQRTRACIKHTSSGRALVQTHGSSSGR